MNQKKRIALNEDELKRVNVLVSNKSDEVESILKRVQRVEEDSLKKDERIHIQAERLEETERKLNLLSSQSETVTKREAALVADSQSMKQTMNLCSLIKILIQ